MLKTTNKYVLAYTAVLTCTLLYSTGALTCSRSVFVLQECFQAGVDTDCTPTQGDGAQESFPMDSSHGFGVAHDKVWDGSVEVPSTGLCKQGTPDAQGRFVG